MRRLHAHAEPLLPPPVARGSSVRDQRLRPDSAAARAIAAATSGQPGSARVRAKASSVAASVATPMSASRCSITSASCGRPLNTCARASRYISAESFLGPV